MTITISVKTIIFLIRCCKMAAIAYLFWLLRRLALHRNNLKEMKEMKEMKEIIAQLRTNLSMTSGGEAFDMGYAKAIDHIEELLEVVVKPEPSLIEQSGYSYSGIAELIRDDPKKRLAFMRELHTAYYEAMQAENAAQKSLEGAKRQSALIHGAYHYTHRVLNTGGDGFCYALDGVTHIVTLRTTIPVIESWKPDIE